MFDSDSKRSELESSASESPAAPWERAYNTLKSLGMHSGMRVSSSELCEMLGIPPIPSRNPGETDRSFASRARTWDLKELAPQRELLKKALLERKGLWLHSVGAGTNGGAGVWEIRNADGAEVLVKATVRDVRKKISSSQNILSSMNKDGLSDQQRAVHADSVAKMAHLNSLMKSTRTRRH